MSMDFVKDDMGSGQFYMALDRQLKEKMRNKEYFRIKICEYIIELRFPSKEEAESMAAHLTGLIIHEEREPNVIFNFWTDDCTHYFGTEGISESWIHEDKDGYMQWTPNEHFVGVNRSNGVFYYCRHFSRQNNPYRMILLLKIWAQENDMRVLHGAVVGVRRKGVLIAARGGGGKSTLSVSCLLSGMEFVSDDYFMIKNHGILRAMPIETTVKLNTDIMEQLNPPLPVIWTAASRNNKKTMDASKYKFCQELSIEAIIYPKIMNSSQPKIVAIDSLPVLMELIQSTLVQMVVSDVAKEAKDIFTRFFGLPVYEMQLSTDLKKNAETLRTFIERRF